MRRTEKCEEMLQTLYCLEEREGGSPAGLPAADLLARAEASAEALKESAEAGLTTETAGRVRLTDAGRECGALVVRRHRLAERLLQDVLGVSPAASEAAACAFEHALAEEVTESVCTFLGHPLACPHGKPIPPGPCCVRHERDVPRYIVRLSELDAGTAGRIAYIHSAQDARLDRLASFGLVPGTEVRVHQTWPSMVIALGETNLALDRETAAEIYVRRMPDAASNPGWNGRRRRRHRHRG
jgi:DtxR family Mn-dependent transcriptional regulator